MNVAVIMTVFNRREKTLECLRGLYAQFDSLRVEGKYNFSVYLTDDGSTDGTTHAVHEKFPDVHIILGDGSLFWNRGMRAAWAEAAKKDFDFYLWLNDDTILKPMAIGALLENSTYLRHKAIVVGTAVDSKGVYSYGGRTKRGHIIEPDKIIPINCDLFNGNLVLVPRAVYETVGMMDALYSHSFGDYDYGVRAQKKGVVSVVAPGVLAQCDRNEEMPKWRNRRYPLKARFAALQSPKGRPFKEQFIFDSRNINVFFAVSHYVSLMTKVVFPKK